MRENCNKYVAPALIIAFATLIIGTIVIVWKSYIPPKYLMLILAIVSIIYIFIIFTVYILHNFIISYFPLITPIIKISMSKDNGETYSSNIHSIPTETDIFLKYEISAKTSFLWRFFLNTNECFWIEFPKKIKLCEASGENRKRYYIHALTNRQKINITLKLPANNNKNEKRYELNIIFESEFLKTYNKTIVLHSKKEKNDWG